jgi:hypothetical protein
MFSDQRSIRRRFSLSRTSEVVNEVEGVSEGERGWGYMASE